jgi:hypothetical protein
MIRRAQLPVSINALAHAIKPAKTVLLLGAGASVPSGAPTGAQLAAELWKRVAKTESISSDLRETATILQRRFSRRAIVDVIVSTLSSLKPSGGILGIPEFGWEKIFTTNFDKLIEDAYRQKNISLTAIRSNYDFSSREADKGTRLFKIHGCISQDESLGDKASMTLTDQDYEDHKRYRQSLFAQLVSTFLEGDVLVIGQSLRDAHLSALIREILNAKQEGAPGQVYALIYETDEYRAPLLEDIGLKIAFGDIDGFVHELAGSIEILPENASPLEIGLPLSLVSTVSDVSIEVARAPNVLRMFNGGAATYADIATQATFERSQQIESSAGISGELQTLTIIGAAGVGKTTFARQLGCIARNSNFAVWEHKTDFIFQAKPWIDLEVKFRSEGNQAILILDECTHYLRQTNTLVEYLGGVEKPALRLILTANAAAWAPRLKSPKFFTKGRIIQLSQLENAEINSLITLVNRKPEISRLVQSNFKSLNRTEQVQALRQKCSADMFVCLKNIFANESLDIILLQEYDELDDAVQELYRYVAALEAVGTRVHRQLIMRMLHVASDQVMSLLTRMAGIVDEYDINPREGIYGWRTRHLVIARKITEYKFSSVQELEGLFEEIIDNINPSVPIELNTIREICDSEFGIGRLGDGVTKQKLYRRLIETAPGERIPWHRLIRELLREGRFEEAESIIKQAESSVGSDAPLDRYKVRLLIVRSQKVQGISEGDRVALLRKAYELAWSNTLRNRWDKYSYYTLCDVAGLLVQKGENSYILQEALSHSRQAADKILDPEMNGRLREIELNNIRR